MASRLRVNRVAPPCFRRPHNDHRYGSASLERSRVKALTLITGGLVNGSTGFRPGSVVHPKRLIFIPRHLPGFESLGRRRSFGRRAHSQDLIIRVTDRVYRASRRGCLLSPRTSPPPSALPLAHACARRQLCVRSQIQTENIRQLGPFLPGATLEIEHREVPAL